jgi:hypothetical protein
MLCNMLCNMLCTPCILTFKLLPLFQWAPWMTVLSCPAPMPGDPLHACPSWRPLLSAMLIRIGSTNLPSLYLCRAENVLCRVPMMQCFVASKQHAHPVPLIWLPQWSCCLYQRGEGQRKKAVQAQPLDVEVWEGPATTCHCGRSRAEVQGMEEGCSTTGSGAGDGEVAPGGAWASGWRQCWWLKGTCCNWMILYTMLCNLLNNSWDLLYNTKGVIL